MVGGAMDGTVLAYICGGGLAGVVIRMLYDRITREGEVFERRSDKAMEEIRLDLKAIQKDLTDIKVKLSAWDERVSQLRKELAEIWDWIKEHDAKEG